MKNSKFQFLDKKTKGHNGHLRNTFPSNKKAEQSYDYTIMKLAQ